MEVIEGKEFHVMTEETANGLAKAFENFISACEEFPKTYSNVFDLHFQNLKLKHEFGVRYYTQKLETSCFLTRWWYKRKLQKEKDRLEAINDIIKRYNANRSDKSPA